MERLGIMERLFYEELIKRKPQRHNGYMRFTKDRKHFKRSRVLIQLHLNKKLNIFEHVHHKDGNKLNDNINNLKVVESREHISKHHAGQKHKGKSGGHNKINTEKEEEIYNLCKIHKKNNGLPNYKRVGNILSLSVQTIRRYFLSK